MGWDMGIIWGGLKFLVIWLVILRKRFKVKIGNKVFDFFSELFFLENLFKYFELI